jgi:serine/threonine protein phosphatase 1
MFSMFMEDYPRTDYRLKPGYDWFHERIGGVETLASYGIDADIDRRIFQLHEDAQEAVPQHHLDFINNLPLTLTAGELLFVHAGIRPGVALEQQTEDDLVWIREGFLDDPRPHHWLIVHGHTTVPEATHYGNRVNLDSGAGYGKPLTAAVFEGSDSWVLTDNGREALKAE